MARFHIETIVSQVVDAVSITDERAANAAAEANITLGADARIVAKSVAGSLVRSALTESNASLASKHHSR